MSVFCFSQASKVLPDADIVAHSAALLGRMESARAAVEAIPVLPVTSPFLEVASMASPEALRAAVAAIFGPLILSPPPPVPHVHTPHCSHSAPTSNGAALDAVRACMHV